VEKELGTKATPRAAAEVKGLSPKKDIYDSIKDVVG
jgi:hypothetical protein